MTIHRTDYRPTMRDAIRRTAEAEHPVHPEAAPSTAPTPTTPKAKQEDATDVSGYLAHHFGVRRR